MTHTYIERNISRMQMGRLSRWAYASRNEVERWMWTQWLRNQSNLDGGINSDLRVFGSEFVFAYAWGTFIYKTRHPSKKQGILLREFFLKGYAHCN